MKLFKHMNLFSAVALLFLLTVMFGSMYVFKNQITRATNEIKTKAPKDYDAYYVMIVEDTKSSFWNSVYEYTKKIGEDNRIYVELMGTQLATEYSKADRMRIAIESKVDGIFLEADESKEITNLINEAVENKIPVITVIGDSASSERQSFVGISSYNLGREYGRQVQELAKESLNRVVILMTAQAKDSVQNIIYSGIQEMLESSGSYDKIQLESIAIDASSSFATEESIRDIFMNPEELPDILICLDELNTTCAYQALIDYNKVGVVNILGYYDSETILNAIQRKVIYSTISIKTEQIGEYLMEAIQEYQTYGQVNEYYTVDTTLITFDNIEEYSGGEIDEK